MDAKGQFCPKNDRAVKDPGGRLDGNEPRLVSFPSRPAFAAYGLPSPLSVARPKLSKSWLYQGLDLRFTRAHLRLYFGGPFNLKTP